jgi:hypothetical protein
MYSNRSRGCQPVNVRGVLINLTYLCAPIQTTTMQQKNIRLDELLFQLNIYLSREN